MNSQMIDPGVNSALSNAKYWAKGYAWIMVVYVGLMALGMIAALIFSGSAFASEMGAGGFGMGFMLIMFLFVLALTLPPILYLFGFVRNSEAALASGNPQSFSAALINLKSFFKFYVILVLIIIAVYAIVLLGALAMGGLSNLAM